MATVKIDGKEFNTDDNNVILDYTQVDQMILNGLTPTGEITIFTIDGVEIETKAKIRLEKGEDLDEARLKLSDWLTENQPAG